MEKRLSDITAKDLLGIKNDFCPSCNKKLDRAGAMANGLIFCNFGCMVAYDKMKLDL